MKITKTRLIIFISVFFLGLVIFPGLVLAKKTVSDAPDMLGITVGQTGVQTGEGSEFSTVSGIVGFAVKLILSIVGIAFFILMVYSGFVWMTARGNEERVTKAKGTIIAATIGLLITVSAYGITNVIMSRITAVGGSAGGGGSTADEGGAGDFGGNPMGCCLYEFDTGPLNLGPAIWQSQITTSKDCDNLSGVGEGQSDFHVGMAADECQNLQNEKNSL